MLDLGAEAAAAAADDQAERLADAGWEMSTGVRPARHDGHSTEANATASVYTLAEYLDDAQYEDAIDAELRDVVPDSDGLILVAVEPRT